MPLPGESSSFGFNRSRPASVAVCTNIRRQTVTLSKNSANTGSVSGKYFPHKMDDEITSVSMSTNVKSGQVKNNLYKSKVNSGHVASRCSNKKVYPDKLRKSPEVYSGQILANSKMQNEVNNGSIPNGQCGNSGQVSTNRFGYRGCLNSDKIQYKSASKKCCEVRPMINTSDTRSFQAGKAALPDKRLEYSVKQIDSKTNLSKSRIASHLPCPQISTQHLRKIPIKSVKTVTNNIMRVKPTISPKVCDTKKTNVVSSFDRNDSGNIVLESLDVIGKQSNKGPNIGKTHENDIHTLNKDFTTNTSKIIPDVNTGFSSDEDDVTDYSEMRKERVSKSISEKDVTAPLITKEDTLPSNDNEDMWGRGEDLAFDEYGTVQEVNPQLRDVLLALEDTSFAPLAILSMPETGFHIEDESFPEFSIRQSPRKKLSNKISAIKGKQVELPESPGTQSDLSNSISSDGKDYFDDEISDQPGFSFYDNIQSDRYMLQNIANSSNMAPNIVTDITSSHQNFEATELLLTSVKEKEIHVSCTYDDASTYDSITSDDLMMNYENEDINGSQSGIQEDSLKDTAIGSGISSVQQSPNKNNTSVGSSCSDSANPQLIIQDIKSKLHELFDVLSVENTQHVDELDEDTENFLILNGCIKNQ